MNEEEFAKVQGDNAIIARALVTLADEDPSPAVIKRANELYRRYKPVDYEMFKRAAKKLARIARKDGETSTTIPHELVVLSERALQTDAEAVENLGARR